MCTSSKGFSAKISYMFFIPQMRDTCRFHLILCDLLIKPILHE